jgi:hypothetical protein
VKLLIYTIRGLHAAGPSVTQLSRGRHSRARRLLLARMPKTEPTLALVLGYSTSGFAAGS